MQLGSTRNSRRIELESLSTLQTPNGRALQPARTSCAGLFSKGDLRYEYNIARLEQKYCSTEKRRERHFLVVDLNTLELVPNEDELEEDEGMDVDPDEVRQQFEQDVHDAFVVPFGEHDIATPADDHSPDRKKKTPHRTRRSPMRPPSPARSIVNVQFEKYYSKQRRRQGAHVHKPVCRPSKRHSIEACLSTSGICFKKPRDEENWDMESNASRPLSRRIEEDFGDDDNLSMRSGFAPTPKARNVLAEKQTPSTTTTPPVSQTPPDARVTRSSLRRGNSRVASAPSPSTVSKKSKPSLGYDEMLNIDAGGVIADSALVRSVYSGQSKSTVKKRTNKKANGEASRIAAGGGSPMVATRLVRHSILVELEEGREGTLDGRILGTQSSRLPGRIYMTRDKWRACGAAVVGGKDGDDNDDDTVSMRSGFVTPGTRIVGVNIRSPNATDKWKTPSPQSLPSSSNRLAIVESNEKRPTRRTVIRDSFSSPPTYDSPKSYAFVTMRRPKNNKRQTPKRREQKALECGMSLGESACSDRSNSPNLSGEFEPSLDDRHPASAATAAARKRAIDCWVSSVRRASETGQFDEDDHVRHFDRTIRQQHAGAKQRNLYNNVGYGD